MERRETNDENLVATRFLNYDHPLVRDRVDQLTGGCADEIERARAIFDFVRDRIVYNFAPEVHLWECLRASHTIELGNGFCVQKAVLLAAMWRAAGIRAKVGFQDIRSHMVPQKYMDLLGGYLGYHGLDAVYLGGRWIRLDATLDRTLVERKGYRLVEFSATQESLLPSTDLAGRPHFVILKDYGDFSDVPEYVADFHVREFKRLGARWKALVNKEDASM